MAVAASKLVSPSAVTDDVILFLPEKVNLLYSFLVIVLQTAVTIRTLSTFPQDHLSSVLTNSAAKNIYFH